MFDFKELFDDGVLFNLKNNATSPYYGLPMAKIVKTVIEDYGRDEPVNNLLVHLGKYINYKTGIYHKFILDDTSFIVFKIKNGNEGIIGFFDEEFNYLDGIFASYDE